ncbi:MAG: NYN domain-containing protein [Firmicutes bacterium]|nr:NYN domain-containing protein [Bacillota bacterium]
METQQAGLQNRLMNAVVYVDYENILELLKQYGKDPLEIGFFKVIQAKLRESDLKIIDFIVYSNFEKKSINSRQQTYLRAIGIQTRHASNNGKNSGDLELTVDALRVLYKNPHINTFVIISSDRDIIPLLKAIKYEDRSSYVISTKNGFNQIVVEYADCHQYIEDLFNLPPGLKTAQPAPELDITYDLSSVTEDGLARAREVARYLYASHIWKRAAGQGEPVSLTGYVNVVARIVNRFPGEILNDFKLAHLLKYVTIYPDQNQRLYLKEGEKKDDIMKFCGLKDCKEEEAKLK